MKKAVEWYAMSRKGDAGEILIYEQIGEGFFSEGLSAKRFMEELAALGDVKSLNVHINSPGGSVFDGNAIYNALRSHGATVNVSIDGLAASIASVIAMAGDTITMPENALMMIHDPWSIVAGDAGDLRKQADALDKMKVGLVAAYHRKSGKDKDELAGLMAAETWFTADEAKAMGLADVVEAPSAAAASVKRFEMLGQFRNLPESLKAEAPAPAQPTVAGVTGVREVANMADPKKPELTREFLAAENPALMETLLMQGRKEGADAERARIKSVRDQLIPGHEGLIESLAMDGSTTGEQAAVKVLAAERAVRGHALAALAADAPQPVAQPVPAAVAAIDPNLPLEERAQMEWDKTPGLRSEFTTFDSYLAYRKADDAGLVRILQK